MDYSEGEKLVYQDKLQAALEFYEALLIKDENDPIALREKTFCLVQLDRTSEAKQLIEKLKTILQNDYKVKYLEIKLIIQQGDSIGSQRNMKELQEFSNGLEQDNQINDCWSLLVRGILSHILKNNFKESLEFFEKSYNIIQQSEKYLIAQEIGTLYHDIYQIEEEEEIQKQLGIPKKDCITHAINWFKRVGEDNPNQGKGYLIISQIYLNQDNYEESEKYCKLAFELETTKPVAQVQLATIILKRDNNLEKSLELLKDAHTILKQSQQGTQEPSAISPEAELIIYQAKTLADKGYIKEALQILEESLKTHPKNPYIYLELGHTLFSSSDEDIPKSVQYYQKCYEIDPEFKDPAPAIAIGSYYLTQIQQLQELEEENERFDSEAELEELVAENEENKKKTQKDSQNSQKTNKKDDGEEEEIVENKKEQNEDAEEEEKEQKDSDDQDSKNKDYEQEIKQYSKKALEQFMKALKIDESRCQKVHKSIASCYRLLNKPTLACQSYEKELEQDPEDVETMTELVTVYRELNNKKKAVSLLEKIFLIDQTNDDMFLLLCELLDNNTDKIVNVLKKVYDRNPHHLDNIAQLIARAYIQFDQRQLFKQPEKWLKTAYDLNPKNPETLYTYGLLYIGKDQYEQALDWLTKCIQIDPDHIDCHETVFELMENYFDQIPLEKIIDVTKILIKNNEEWLSEKIIVCKNNDLLNAIKDQINHLITLRDNEEEDDEEEDEDDDDNSNGEEGDDNENDHDQEKASNEED
ncbi:tetratricopeptide repeat protein (macronuclear) [Tetrahymena thermophila SB210]|uniref:Tetratricopeptide repeat protein n=1 Tax=Tetrahymena thermophila (strain SB210) TaxID=312017 RepID=I7LZZ2_TETTS|nr:tetratricopeptide repeat protein [Tetrahymena thermophila SB210]EAR85179.1 tetratricopeptide repeat protein [Tetrahymena thermophila SB210]|eukprot:XP_001032842.1 tetratricopeptide repeat protein [Tetrahymena thermophila SB210]